MAQGTRMEELVEGKTLQKLQQQSLSSLSDNKWLLCTNAAASNCLNHRKAIATNLSSTQADAKLAAKTVAFPKTNNSNSNSSNNNNYNYNYTTTQGNGETGEQRQQVRLVKLPQVATTAATLSACVSILMSLLVLLNSQQAAGSTLAAGSAPRDTPLGGATYLDGSGGGGEQRAAHYTPLPVAWTAPTLDRLKLLEWQLELALNGRRVATVTPITFSSQARSSSLSSSPSSSSSSNSNNNNLDSGGGQSQVTSGERKRRMSSTSITGGGGVSGGGGGVAGSGHQQQLVMSPLDQMTAIESLNSLLDDDNPSRLGRAYKPKSMSTARGFGKRSGAHFGVGR